MNRTSLTLAVGAAISLCQQATAQTEPLTLEPLTVTGARWADSETSSTIGASSRISRAEIEASASSDLLDLLRRQAGIDVARTGGTGSQTSVFFRGSNSNHVLVLIDGVRVAATGTGAFTWEHLPLEQVQQIDIVRGPQASFYGSDAIGGLISIITRRADGVSGYVEAGSDDSYRASLSFGGGRDDLRYWATIGHRRSDGFDATLASNPFNNPDRDGYENSSLNIGVSAAVGQQHRLRANVLLRDASSDFDQGVSDTEAAQLALRLTGDLTDTVNHALQLAVVTEELDTASPFFSSAAESQRRELDWQVNLATSAETTWTVGVNAIDESGENAGSFDLDRDNIGLFGGWSMHADRHRFELSVRHDDTGSETTGRAAWQLMLSDAWSMNLSHGTAFRLANFNELFSPGFVGGVDADGNPIFSFAGNPDLQPETSASSELGVVFNGDAHRFSVAAYATEIEDLISFAGTNFQAINIAEADLHGIEFGWGYRNGPWDIDANYTWQEAEDGNGNPLLRRAEHKSSMTAQREYRFGTLGLELIYQGDRPDFGQELSSYTLANLRAQVPLSDQWSVQARLENLADERYEQVAGYATPGRSLFIGLRWR